MLSSGGAIIFMPEGLSQFPSFSPFPYTCRFKVVVKCTFALLPQTSRSEKHFIAATAPVTLTFDPQNNRDLSWGDINHSPRFHEDRCSRSSDIVRKPRKSLMWRTDRQTDRKMALKELRVAAKRLARKGLQSVLLAHSKRRHGVTDPFCTHTSIVHKGSVSQIMLIILRKII